MSDVFRYRRVDRGLGQYGPRHEAATAYRRLLAQRCLVTTNLVPNRNAAARRPYRTNVNELRKLLT